MKLVFLALSLFLACGAVQAKQVTFSYTLPTLDTDGNAIDPAGDNALTAVRIEYGTCNVDLFGTIRGSKTSTAIPVPSQQTLQIPPGNYCARAFAINALGESNSSVVVKFTVRGNRPQVVVITGVN